ncbi:MAG: hypothetical protein IPN36_12510 [Bacteroidetes bacterium]|nr:hypothetical protein [Bacteroidota bacterium]
MCERWFYYYRCNSQWKCSCSTRLSNYLCPYKGSRACHRAGKLTSILHRSAGGIYTIHTLVYDPSTLNLGIVVPGTTTGFDVNALLIQGGGSICASLDVTGAPVIVNDPDAGTPYCRERYYLRNRRYTYCYS